MNYDDYIKHDALALAGLVRSGSVTPGELIDVAAARIEQVNPLINSVVYSMIDDARGAADTDGPFNGVPFLAKDLQTEYAGHPTSGGTTFLKGIPREHDTELAARIRASGARIIGKTNTPELGLVPFTEPRVWGPCRNPWDTTRSPAGSSGGSAASVAAGVVPMAGGGDGGGSIRMPASCCGLFGLKPTRGRTPTGPELGQSWRGAAQEHVLTRSVRDSAAMLDATQGADPGSPYEIPPPTGAYLDEVSEEPARLRIAWTTQPILGDSVHPDCVAAVEDAVRLLGDLGHHLEEAAPVVDKMDFNRSFVTLVASEVGADVRDAESLVGRRARRTDFEPATWALRLLSEALSSRDLAIAMRTLEGTGRTMGRFFQTYDMLLTPTLAQPPLPIGALAPKPGEERLLSLLGMMGSGRLVRALGLLDEVASKVYDFMPWTPLFNISGQPAMSVPLFWSEGGLPIGAHLVGRFGDEATLFRLAGQLERARPWFSTLPSLATDT
jgi:amidase